MGPAGKSQVEGGGPVAGPPLTLVLLAAGLGTRFGGLKQLEPLGPGGATLMDYSVFDACRTGFTRAVFVIRPEMADAFERDLGARYRTRIEVATVFQRLDDLPAGFTPPPGRSKPWGTTHAVLAARSAVEGPFVVLNADDCYGQPALEAVAGFLRRTPAEVGRQAVVAYRLDATASPAGGVNRAVLELGPGGMLRRIVETRGLVQQANGDFRGAGDGVTVEWSPATPVSMNLWGLFPSIFPVLAESFTRFLRGRPDAGAECFFPDTVGEAVAEGRLEVEVLPARGEWCGVTYPDDRSWVRDMLAGRVARGEYPERLWP